MQIIRGLIEVNFKKSRLTRNIVNKSLIYGLMVCIINFFEAGWTRHYALSQIYPNNPPRVFLTEIPGGFSLIIVLIAVVLWTVFSEYIYRLRGQVTSILGHKSKVVSEKISMGFGTYPYLVGLCLGFSQAGKISEGKSSDITILVISYLACLLLTLVLIKKTLFSKIPNEVSRVFRKRYIAINYFLAILLGAFLQSLLVFKLVSMSLIQGFILAVIDLIPIMAFAIIYFVIKKLIVTIWSIFRHLSVAE